MRENTIKVSDSEKETLDAIREDVFGSQSVPYGEVIQYLAEQHHEQ